MTTAYQALIDILDRENIEYTCDQPLAPYTTWGIGGPADILVIARATDVLIRLYSACVDNSIPYTVLGGGSDILISDEGIRGLVIINKTANIAILDSEHGADRDLLSITTDEANAYSLWIEPRHGEVGNDFYSFEDLDYAEEGETTLIKFDSGVVLSYAIAWGLKNGFTGLQWFAGIPGTMGGALYNNIHGGTRHFSDNFIAATIIDSQGVRTVGREFFEFGYDQSVLRSRSDIIILDVTMKMYTTSDVAKAKYVAQEWARRKRLQPRKSAGCVFQNITREDQLRNNFDSPSVGYIVDKKLGWAGKQEGGAMISDKHAAFIENKENATAAEIIILIKAVKDEVKQKFGIDLHTEINLLGFDNTIMRDIKGL